MSPNTSPSGLPYQVPGCLNISAESPIGILDTGMGGIVHAALLNLLYPNENLVVLKVNDFRFAGNQKPGDIAMAFHRGVAKLVEEAGCKMVNVCCNSASCALYRAGLLTSHYTRLQSLLLPAIALSMDAAGQYPGAHHAQMATHATVNSRVYVENLRELIASRGKPVPHISSVAVPTLIALIENCPISNPAIRVALESELGSLDSTPQVLGLFCSHLEILATTHRDVFNDRGIRLLLPGRQLAEETGARLTREQLLNPQKHAGTIKFRTTIPDAAAISRMETRFLEVQPLLR